MNPPHPLRLFLVRAVRAVAMVLVLAVCPALSGAAPTAPGVREALVIGNASYETFERLDNPAHDRADMCDALRQTDFQATCLGDIPDRASFLARVQEFASRLGSQTASVFYYAGHAVQVDGENYLVPIGAQLQEPGDIHEQFVALGEVLALLGKNTGRFQLIVLDACRSDPFSAQRRSENERGGRADSAPDSTRQRSLRVLVGAMQQSHTRYGLAAIKDAPPGTMVLYATASDDTAFDGDGRNGPLTKHLLANIRARGLGIDDLVKRVMDGVRQETRQNYGRAQTPFIYSSFSGNFCFNCRRPVDLPPTF
ncbi:MAG: caspase domain-containing protein [Leptothrix sp. (in: b-proteobacteria)]